MTLEGSRKFVTQILILLGIWIVAKFGPAMGGIWNTAIPTIAFALGGGLYFLVNYLQKTTADVFVPENWLSGKRTVISFILMIIAPILTSASTELKDVVTQGITLVADIAVPALCMLFQGLSDRKMKNNVINGTAEPAGKPTTTAAENPPAAVSNVTAQQAPAAPAIAYLYIDVDALGKKLSDQFKDPIALAYAFRAKGTNSDIMQVRPADRVKQATEFVGKSRELFENAFVIYTGGKVEYIDGVRTITGGSAIPTDAELGNLNTLNFRVRKDYERIHNVVCSTKTFDELRAMTNTLQDFVRLDQGRALLSNLSSENLPWNEVFGPGTGNRTFSFFDVFDYASNLVSELPKASKK